MNKKLNVYSDDELLKMLKGGDLQIEDYLLDKYKPFVKKTARLYYLEGGDEEDLLQEGMVGLFKAVREYDPEREASFYTFARLCICRQMISAVHAANRKKHMPLNESVSLNDISESEMSKNVSGSLNPETIMLENEAASMLITKINKNLSKMEKKVFEQYISGHNYIQIAENMGKPVKSIDNALQRIRNKIKKAANRI